MSNSRRIRILCISPLFVPLSDAEAFCGAKLVKALLEQGLDVTVLWSSNFKAKNTGYDDSDLWKPLREISVDVPVPRGPRLGALPSVLRYRTRFDSRWVKSAVCRALEMHSKTPFDIIYSRSLPMAAHIAGYWCARHLNLPWFVNINDPWDHHYCPTLPKTLYPSRVEQLVSDYWLKKSLRSAAVVTFPSKALLSHHGAHMQASGRMDIFPHVGCAVAHAFIEKDTNPKFNLVHAGRLSDEEYGRSTRALLVALAGFLDRNPSARSVTRLTLVGAEDKDTKDLSTELALEDVRFLGRLSYEGSLREISKAAVCILVEGAIGVGIFLPSKLVDYITARKPILALSPPAGVAADMAASGELLRVDADDAPAIQAAIGTLYSDFQNGTLHSRAPREAFVRQFDHQTLGRRFLEAVEQVLSAGPSTVKPRTINANYESSAYF